MNTPSGTPESDVLVTTTRCETSSDFIAALSPRSPSYGSAFLRGWIFRGHPEDDFRLVPAALRDESQKLRNLTLFPIVDNKSQQRAEREVLARFLQVSDSIGLNLPEDTQKLRSSFAFEATPVDLWPPDEVLSLMALAQHHGIPTRLLDWSRHPLKAAWFAASEASQHENKSGLLSVWAFSIENLEMLGDSPTPFTLITAPSATNSNLRAQEGVFTLAKHIKPDQSPIDRAPFDEIFRSWVGNYHVNFPGPKFHRITLPKSEAEQLCFDLALEGITRAKLFPDFYGVVKAIEDEAAWYRNDGAPGKKRAEKHLDSFAISYQTTIRIGSE